MKKSYLELGQFLVQLGIYVCLLVIIGILAGCAHDTRTPEEREYDNQVYLETQFIPAVENCIRSGGTLVYDGPYSSRIRNILDKKAWLRLHRTDTIHFACMEK